jgi:hypothetical protein
MGLNKGNLSNPLSDHSFGYAMGMNYAPGGTIETWEVTPSDRRITGATENGKAQRDSIARQYGKNRSMTAAA